MGCGEGVGLGLAQVGVSDFDEGLFVEDVHGLRFYALNILRRNSGKTKEDVAAEFCKQLGVVKCPSNVVGEAVGESLAANPVDSTHDYQVSKASPKGRKTQHHVKHPSNSSGGQSREVSERKCSAESPDSRQLEIAVNPNRASLRRREMLDAELEAKDEQPSGNEELGEAIIGEEGYPLKGIVAHGKSDSGIRPPLQKTYRSKEPNFAADKAAVPSLSPVVDVFSVPASVVLPRRSLDESDRFIESECAALPQKLDYALSHLERMDIEG